MLSVDVAWAKRPRRFSLLFIIMTRLFDFLRGSDIKWMDSGSRMATSALR